MCCRRDYHYNIKKLLRDYKERTNLQVLYHAAHTLQNTLLTQFKVVMGSHDLGPNRNRSRGRMIYFFLHKTNTRLKIRSFPSWLMDHSTDFGVLKEEIHPYKVSLWWPRGNALDYQSVPMYQIEWKLDNRIQHHRRPHMQIYVKISDIRMSDGRQSAGYRNSHRICAEVFATKWQY